VVIFNVREQTWYDCVLSRSAGFYSQVFKHPVMVSSEPSNKRNITVTVNSGSFLTGDQILGSTTGTLATILVVNGTTYTVILENNFDFELDEDFTNLSRSGGGTVDFNDKLYGVYAHEKGLNAVDNIETAIESYFTTADFGLPANQGLNNLTRITRIEPDFIQTGDMNVAVISTEYAKSEETIDGPFTFSDTDEKVDMRVQRRHLQLKFSSNTINGHYEMGKVILWTEPGDVRP